MSTLFEKVNVLVLVVLALSSLFVFQTGFLLRRTQLKAKSACSDVSISSSSCWVAPTYSRVILFLIDALRYDFLAHSNGSEFFHGQMPFTRSLVQKGAMLTRAFADPPTTTLQRVKAIGTGSLPTFIDASDNFNPNAQTEEDNLFYQLHENGKETTLLGDSTWLSVFPYGFHREFGMDSFDIHDLHTVDRHIMKHLGGELARGNVSLLIAHFLGVDHAGHKYGPSHVEMAAKLREMDGVVKGVVGGLRPSDLLIIMGDHGMTSTGDHGGDSADEVTAAFLAYSPSTSFNCSSLSSIHQIDLVPSLSLLLDLPIPFSSLGSPIECLFPSPQAALNALRLTAFQVQRYVSAYGGLVNEASKWEDLQLLSASQLRSLLFNLQSALRDEWTKFDVSLMRIALLSLVDAVCGLLCSSSHSSPSYATLILRHSNILLLWSLVVSPSSALPHTLLTLSTPLTLIYSLSQLLFLLPSLLSPSLIPYSLLSLSFLIPFSNSLIVYEPLVLRFLFSSLLLFSFIFSLRRSLLSSPSNRSFFSFSSLSSLPLLLSLLFLLRLSFLFHRCREEDTMCVQYPFPLPSLSVSFSLRAYRILSSLFSLSALLYLLRVPSLSSLHSLSQSLSPLTVFLSLLHFSSSLLPDHLHSLYFPFFQLVALSVYFLSLFSLILLYFSPPSPYFAHAVLRTVSVPLCLLLGDGVTPTVPLLVYVLLSLRVVVPRSWMVGSVLLLFPLSFSLLGHSPTLSSIPWQAAFIGVDASSAPRWVSATLLLLNLFSHVLLIGLSLPLLFPPHPSLPLLSSLLALALLRTLLSSVAVTLLRRHLMVWKVFAPHWIFDGVSLIILLILFPFLHMVYSRKMHAK